MTPTQFVQKWKLVALTERAAAQSHFNDLCAMLGHPDPISADPTGESFAFEKGVTKTGGGEGFADVWKRGFFAWEYKKKKVSLEKALEQLVRYAAALENPPLQVACDTDRILIRTAWTNAVPETYTIELDELADPQKLDILRAVFFDPEKLRPKLTRAGLTKEAADKFSTIALRLQGAGTPEEIAHFVNQLVFCFFANSVELLPKGLFPKLLKRGSQKPERLQRDLTRLFEEMNKQNGEFDLTDIAWFNGGLFDGRPALSLDLESAALLVDFVELNWSQIDPTIFGTLFERFLDPQKRKQIGAHYTDAEKIMRIVEPVVLRPLRHEWAIARAEIEVIMREAEQKRPVIFGRAAGSAVERAIAPFKVKAEVIRSRFLDRLSEVRVLDPACGSGNFLYLALQGLRDIENTANLECEAWGLPPRRLVVAPENLLGMEINPVAAELARTTIWIGNIQWDRRNGVHFVEPPILRKLDNIECRDALIEVRELSPQRPGSSEWRETHWPAAEFIVGNPPFLGSSRFSAELGSDYLNALEAIYGERVGGAVDLYVYWFEKARVALAAKRSRRVGLVSKNTFEQRSNRHVLLQITHCTQIFEAWTRLPWVNEGAAVQVHLICFGQESHTILNGTEVNHINWRLRASSDDPLEGVVPTKLQTNRSICFNGVKRNGPFDVDGTLARSWLTQPVNPNGRTNADVLSPYMNGDDLVGRSRDKWLVDFGFGRSASEIKLYEHPYEYIESRVKPARSNGRTPTLRNRWWEFEGLRKALRTKLSGIKWYFAISEKSHQYVWRRLDARVIPDNRLLVIALDSYPIFGIVQSRYHERWMESTGSLLEDRRCYTPTTTFETFPFPEGMTPDIPAAEYADDLPAQAIAAAAKRLDELRKAWLNPPDLVRIEPEVTPTAAPGEEPVRYPDRILPKDAAAAEKLKQRTLTKLYNQRPQWLADAHRDLDAAVAAAYGWPADISEEDALAKLLELNLERSRKQAETEVTSPLRGGRARPAKGGRVREGETAKPSQPAPARRPRKLRQD